VNQQEQVDAICQEIDSLQRSHDRLLGVQAYLLNRIAFNSEIIGLMKGLCVLKGWPMDEATPDGRAGRFLRWWAGVPRETSKDD
jgi:hypothetical protein